MHAGRTERWLPLTGIGAALLIFAAFMVGGETPDTDAGLGEVARYYAAHDGDLQAVAILAGLAGVLMLLFSSALRSGLAAGEGRPSTWSNAAFAGALCYAIGLLVASSLSLALSELPDPVAPTVVQSVHIVSNDMFLAVLGGSMVLLIGSGAAILRGGALPRWLGWAGLVIGLVGPTPAGFFSLTVGLLWILVASILLIVRGGAPAPAAPEPS